MKEHEAPNIMKDNPKWRSLNAKTNIPSDFADEKELFDKLCQRHAANQAAGCTHHFCQLQRQRSKSCCGLQLLVCSYTVEGTGRKKTLQPVSKPNIPFLAVQPVLSKLLKFLKAFVDSSKGPIAPEMWAEFTKVFEPYLKTNADLFRLRGFNGAPALCHRCIAWIVDVTFTMEDIRAVQSRDHVTTNKKTGKYCKDAQGRSPPLQLWDRFYKEYLYQAEDQKDQKDRKNFFTTTLEPQPESQPEGQTVGGQTTESVIASHMIHGSMIHTTIWRTLVENFFAEKKCRPDKWPLNQHVLNILKLCTGLNATTKTLETYISHVRGVEKSTAYVIADPNMICSLRLPGTASAIDKNEVLKLTGTYEKELSKEEKKNVPDAPKSVSLQKVAFKIDDDEVQYDYDVTVHEIKTKEGDGTFLCLPNNWNSENQSMFKGLHDLFPGKDVESFEAEIKEFAGNAFKRMHKDDAKYSKHCVRVIAWQGFRGPNMKHLCYHPHKWAVPLEALLEMEAAGHLTLSGIVPMREEGVWFRALPEPPIDVTKDENDPSLLGISVDKKRKTKWACELPFAGSLEIFLKYKDVVDPGVPDRSRSEPKKKEKQQPNLTNLTPKTRSARGDINPPKSSSHSTRMSGSSNKTTPKLSKEQRETAATVRKPRKDLDTLSSKFQDEGGAKESVFVYVNRGNICLLSSKLLIDSHLRTDPYGSAHLKCLFILEDPAATGSKSCDSILEKFKGKGHQTIYDQKNKTVPVVLTKMVEADNDEEESSDNNDNDEGPPKEKSKASTTRKRKAHPTGSKASRKSTKTNGNASPAQGSTMKTAADKKAEKAAKAEAEYQKKVAETKEKHFWFTDGCNKFAETFFM